MKYPVRTGMGSLPLLRSIGHGSLGCFKPSCRLWESIVLRKHLFARKSSEVKWKSDRERESRFRDSRPKVPQHDVVD
jgi:hypothetical protein